MSRSSDSSQRPADVGARAILRPAFDQLLALEAEVASEADASALHALRVALRRMRSVLRELEPVLPATSRDALARALRKLARRTSPVRDLDVLCVAFDRYRDTIPSPHRKHLEPVRVRLDEERARAVRELGVELTKPRRRRLEATFAKFEAADLGEEPPSLEAVVRARAKRLAKRVRKHGRDAGPESAATDLHELRKEVKRLRYLLEIFPSSFPGRERRAILRDMKGLQDALGAVQDLTAHRAILDRVALGGLRRAEPKTYVAAGMLLEHLAAEETRARAALPKAYERFVRRKSRARVKRATRVDADG